MLHEPLKRAKAPGHIHRTLSVDEIHPCARLLCEQQFVIHRLENQIES